MVNDNETRSTIFTEGSRSIQACFIDFLREGFSLQLGFRRRTFTLIRQKGTLGNRIGLLEDTIGVL